MDMREINMVGGRTRERIVTPRACAALTARSIALTGTSEARAGFRFHRMAPAMTQALACVGGHGRVLIDGRWVRCGSHQAYVTPPGAAHAYEAVRGVTWRLAWVMYQPGLAGTDVPRLARADGESLWQAIMSLHRETLGPGDAAVMHHAVQLVHLLAQRIIGPAEGTHRLTQVWDRVHRQPDYPWDMAELATLADMSEEHLRRLSQRETGRSPMRQVTVLRMQRAEALLATGSLTMAQVARAVGYADAFSFSTAFSRWCGRPPSSVRHHSATAAPRRRTDQAGRSG